MHSVRASDIIGPTNRPVGGGGERSTCIRKTANEPHNKLGAFWKLSNNETDWEIGKAPPISMVQKYK